MKNLNLFFAFAVVGVMVSSCNKGASYADVQGEENVPASGETISVYASSENAKTVLDQDAHKQINWVQGDQIEIFNADCTKHITLFTDKGGATAMFTGTVPPDFGTPGCAIYPASAAVSCEGSTITYKVPAEQTYAKNSFGPGANVAVGKLFPKEGKPGDYTLAFKNVSGSVKLQLSGYLNVGKIVLKTKAAERLNGLFAVDVESEDPAGTAVEGEIKDEEKEITLNCYPEVPLKLERTEIFYIALPVGTLSAGFSFTVYDKDGKALCTKSTSKNNSIPRSTAKVIPEQIIVKHEVDPENPDPLPEHHSNTIVITKPGVYSIDCTVKGNGYDPENPGQIATIDTDKAVRAAIIWETSDGRWTSILDQEKNVRYVPSEKKIYFVTNNEGLPEGFRKGNAVIALLSSDRDTKELNGNVLWSWHIWIADDNALTDETYGGYVFMDRNLGATAKGWNSNDAMGLLYQWGRKDPFTGGYNHTNLDPETYTTWGTTFEGTWYGANTIPTIHDPEHPEGTVAQNTIAYAITNPRTMLMGGVGSRHWNSDNKTNLWGAGSKKTMYDPCPYGYKVPDEEAFSAFTGLDHTLTFGYGYSVGGNFWHFTGLRGLNHDYVYKFANTSSQYWTNKAEHNEGVNGYVGSTFDMTNDDFKAGISYAHSANPVRCQKYDAEN